MSFAREVSSDAISITDRTVVDRRFMKRASFPEPFVNRIGNKSGYFGKFRLAC